MVVPPALVHGAISFGQESFMLMCLYYQLISGFLSDDHLPRVSCQSGVSVGDKSDNVMIPVIVERCPGIYFKAEENRVKRQLVTV